MSLEKALEENTKALKELTAALQNAPVASASNAEDKPAKEEKKADKKADKKAEDKPAKEEKKAAKKDDKPDYESDKYLNEVKPLTLKVIKAKNREAVADVLAEFGDDLKSAKDLTADQYDDYMEKLNAVLEDGEDLA